MTTLLNEVSQSTDAQLANAAVVEVLLATYNGERFLPDLLDSLLRQTFGAWVLLARDDGSDDGTVEILRRWGEANFGRLRVLENNGGSLGAAGNFSRLLAASTAPIVAFCDQDDVWIEDRLAHAVAAIRDVERSVGIEHPVLVHSDLEVVDADLRVISPSLWRMQRTPRASVDPVRLAIRNTVTGCASTMNRALVDLANPVPPAAAMHDWWCALVASSFGTTVTLDTATVRYRQHGANEVGATNRSLRNALKKAARFLDRKDLRAGMAISGVQATAFLDRFGSRLDPLSHARLQALATLSMCGPLRRRSRILRYRLFSGSVLDAAGLLVRI